MIVAAWLVFAVGLAFGACVLALRFVVLPRLDDYRPSVERMLSRDVGLPVTIAALSGEWHGLRPHIEWRDLRIARRDGTNALHIAHASATLAWRSLLALEPRLHSLTIDGPELDVRRSADGRWSIAGIAIDPDASDDGHMGDLLLAQELIEIHHASVAYTDALRPAGTITLREVGIVLRNHGVHHEFGVRAQPPDEIATRIDLRGNFTHARFARNSADWRAWSGALYADFGTADLGEIARHAPAWLATLAGRGSVRAWLTLDEGRIDALTADVALEHAALRVRPDAPLLEIADASGRVVMRELPRRELHGAHHGHEIGLQHFGFRMSSGDALAPTELSERLLFDAHDTVTGGALSSGAIDLQALAALIEHLPIGAARATLARVEPRGRVSGLDYRWTGAADAPSHYALKARFEQLTVRAQPATEPPDAVSGRERIGTPGFEHLSGHVDLDESTGQLQLDTQQAVLSFPGVFEAPTIALDALTGRVDWQRSKDGWRIVASGITFANPEVAGSFNARFDTAPQGPGVIDLDGRIDRAQATSVYRYLPLGVPEHTRRWVEQAFSAGVIDQGLARVRGDLAKFPFDSARDGDFKIALKLHDATLNVAPQRMLPDGRTPVWPAFKDVHGDLVFERNGFTLTDAAFVAQGLAVQHVNVRMPSFADPRHLLFATGQSTGPLRALIDFANASPVGRWLGNALRDAIASGDARLGLKLVVPLASTIDTTVQGDLALLNDELTFTPFVPTFSRANGHIEFTQSGATVRGLTATVLGGPIRIDGGPRPDGAVALHAEGTATVDGMRKQYDHPVFDRASGQTRYTTQLVLGKGHGFDLTLDSTLTGVALDLPAPLRKDAAAAMPLHLQIGPAASGSVPFDPPREEIRTSLGDMVRFVVERELPEGAPSRVTRAALGVNDAADLPGAGTVANVRLQAVDADAWRQLLADRPQSPARRAGDAAGAGPVALGDMPEPFIVNAQADMLTIAGKRFDAVVLGATQSDRVWAISVAARQTEGALQWRRAGPNLPAGRLTARLVRLQLEQAQASDVVELLDAAPPEEVPALDVIVEDLALPRAHLGRLEMDASNTGRGPRARWELKRLRIENPSGTLQATGAWARDGTARARRMQLDFALDVKDAGDFLDRLGFKRQMRGGTARMNGAVSWNGSPLALDMPTLSGTIDLEAAHGQFLKVEPGAARLLSLMSLQSIPRRLTFDFRDLFAEGFAFDTLRASSRIENGTLRTQDFRMQGATATVLLEGGVDLAHETQNMHLVVLPQLDATGASVAYGFLVNPAIGLGTFLAQLLLKDPLSKALAFEYNVTGSWNDPQVEKVKHDSGSAAPSAG